MTEKFDLIIAWASPAGTSTVLASKGSGLKIALIDKAKFLRDKVCGDFIMARAPKFLTQYAPALKETLANFPEKAINKSTALFIDDQDPVIWEWVQRSITMKREDFNGILLEEALKVEGVHFFLGKRLKKCIETRREFR